MNKKILCFMVIFYILNIPLLLPAQEKKTAYVSDVLVLTVRKGPGRNFEVFNTVESDEKLVVLEEKNGYSKVELLNGEIGWVQTQYLTFKTPDPIIIYRLNKKLEKATAKNSQLIQKIQSLKKENNLKQDQYMQEKKNLKSELSKSILEQKSYLNQYSSVNDNYEKLLEKSKNVVIITRENKKLKLKNNEFLEKIENLENRNKTLLKTGMIKWFLSGAGVIFLGWIIGRSVSSKKTRHGGLLS